MMRTELADLAAWAETRLPRLIDDACGAIVDRIPLYSSEDPVPAEELRRSVEHNLRFLVTALGHPQAPLDLTVPQATGRRRAQQGAPLPEVLQAYRVGFATLWDALAEHARRSRQPATVDALLTAASMIWQLTDEHALALTEAYRAATAELLLAQQRRRSALVEALLSGHPSPEAGPWEAAALLGLPADGHLVVVAADTRGLAEESLPNIERRLAARGIVSGWRLTPAQQLGVVSLHADQRDTVLGVLREAAHARTGISPPYRSLGDTPRALRLAQAALAGLPSGVAEVRMFNPSPLAALMVCEPSEGRRLADQVLGAVVRLPPEDRSTLLDTLNAYLDHEGSAERAADVLYCHPNTVRYRLRRLQELTGRSLTDPHGVAELATAAYALRLSSATALWRGQPPAAGNGRKRANGGDQARATSWPAAYPGGLGWTTMSRDVGRETLMTCDAPAPHLIASSVSEAMIRCPKLLGPAATVAAVRELFTDDHVHAALVVDRGTLLAVVEPADLDGSARVEEPAVTVGRLDGRVTQPDADLATTRTAMTALGRRRLAVVDDRGICVGLLCLKRNGLGFCSDADVRARAQDPVHRDASA